MRLPSLFTQATPIGGLTFATMSDGASLQEATAVVPSVPIMVKSDWPA